MTFLQPILLAGLPLVSLPIIIHLINQRRYQTVRWAAMMFLLAANRMSRGYARIRQWLIMAVRMLAIAGLIVAISRPLAGGWLGLAGGGRAETTLILVDRSPSMQQTGSDGGSSPALRDAVLECAQGVRCRLLAYPQAAPRNVSVRVTDVRRQKTAEAAELLVSLRLAREGGEDVHESIPIHFEIDGARSEVTV